MWLIVDGYNAIMSSGFLDDNDFKVLKNRRERFLSLLSKYANGTAHRVTVVFDGNKGGDVLGGAESFGEIEVK